MALPAPLDIDSYSKAFLEGKLDQFGIKQLREVLSPEAWAELAQERYHLSQLLKLNAIKAKTREQIDLSDVVALLIMLLEKPL